MYGADLANCVTIHETSAPGKLSGFTDEIARPLFVDDNRAIESIPARHANLASEYDVHPESRIANLEQERTVRPYPDFSKPRDAGNFVVGELRIHLLST